MLTLTTDTPHTFSATEGEHGLRVAIGSGLAVNIPDGPGRPSLRWHRRADEVVDKLKELYAQHGTALEYRWVALPGAAQHTQWMEIRVVHDALPAECLLAHPKISKVLLETLELTLGTHPAVYYHDGQIRALAAQDAREVCGWIGPMDLSAGYCMALHIN